MNRNRWKVLLDGLTENQFCTSEMFAKQLHLSKKTIQNELKELKMVLEENGAQLFGSTRKGYSLHVYDESKFQAYRNVIRTKQNIPESSEQRIQYLLEALLMNNDHYIKLDEISDKIYVSKASLTLDLKKVRELLESFHLRLISRPHYGIKVEGSEMNLRLCLAAYTLQRMKTGDENLNDTLGTISDCIMKELKNTQIKISDASFHNLVIHLYIALQRVKAKNYVPILNNESGLEMEYRYATHIIANLEESFALTIPKNEIWYVALHLASKRIIETESGNENCVISDQIYQMVDLMLDNIWNNYRMDFRDDLELRMDLAMHLVPFDTRIKHDMHLKNPLLKEIKTRYTLAYMMAISACEVLYKQYYKQIKEDEIGYIALHFNLSIERHRSPVSKLNLLVVCATGRGSSQMLMWKIRDQFGKYIKKIDSCELLQLYDLDITKIDYVLTTIPIPVKLNRPILQIEQFLDDKDVENIQRLLDGRQPFNINQYFNSRLFLPHMIADHKQEVIQQMIQQIRKVYSIPDDFYDAVMRREEMAVTAFGNLVAVPHPDYAMGKESFVCVAILEKPIHWGNQLVQFVFLLSLKESGSEEMQLFTKIVSKMLFSSTYIQQLIHDPQYQTMIHILNEIERERND